MSPTFRPRVYPFVGRCTDSADSSLDQAVLALGREQRLDPLPDFITGVRSHLVARDTRGLAFGVLPFAEEPGDGEGLE
jgi:hypothetical protein